MALDSVESGAGPSKPDSIEYTPLGSWADWGPVADITNGVGANKLPTWYDITGEQHVNYSYALGPHAGKSCDCGECHKFNQDYGNRVEQMKMLDKVHKDAHDIFGQYFIRASMPNVRIDVKTAMQIMVNFAEKQIADYQKQTVERVHKIQLAHTAQIAHIKSTVNAQVEERHKRDREKLKTGEHDGRLFRVGPNEEIN